MSTPRPDYMTDVVRVWSLRPWLYKWHQVPPLDKPDKALDEQWRKWLRAASLLEINRDFKLTELTKPEMKVVDRAYRVCEMVLSNQDLLKAEGSMADMERLYDVVVSATYVPLPLSVVLGTLTDQALAIFTMRKLRKKLKNQDDKLLLVFVCYNYYLVHKVQQKLKGGLRSLFKLHFEEAEVTSMLRIYGNVFYDKREYTKAIVEYTKALDDQPYIYTLYSNRSSCYLQSNQLRAAACDALRTVRIAPTWEKGWWRYALALFKMGCHNEAGEANMEGQRQCSEKAELIKQLEDFTRDLTLAKQIQDGEADLEWVSPHPESPIDESHKTPTGTARQTVGATTVSDSDDMPDLVDDDDDVQPAGCPVHPDVRPLTKKDGKPTDKPTSRSQSDKPTSRSQSDKPTSRSQSDKPTSRSQSDKPTSRSQSDKPSSRSQSDKPTSRSQPARKRRHEGRGHSATPEDNKSAISQLASDTKDLLSEGTKALIENRMRNAATFYCKALYQLSPDLQKELLYHDEQVAVIRYSLGYASFNLGTEKDVEDALSVFRAIETDYQTIIFPLVFLGMGMAYCRWNRYKEAQPFLAKGLRIVQKHRSQPVLTWPESTVCIPETRGNQLKMSFEYYLALCRQPPKADAVCRYNECGQYQLAIYISDPDFKGYVELHCFADCRVAFHNACWKKAKTASDKEILSGTCWTPDCKAPLKKILMFDHNGETAKDLPSENVYQKNEAKKPVLKMKPSSQYTIRRREERKEQRKKKRAEAIRPSEEGEELVNEREQNVENTHTTDEEPQEAPTFDLKMCTKIINKRDEQEEEENKKPKKSKRKAQRDKILTLINFNNQEADVRDASSPSLSSFAGLDDYHDSPMIYPVHQSGSPLTVPPSVSPALVTDTPPVPTPDPASNPWNRPRSQTDSSGKEDQAEDIDEANNRLAIRDSLFELFKEELEKSGPLHFEDRIITSVVADLPLETQEIINSEGGISKFLAKSLYFVTVGDHVGLLKDVGKIRKLAKKKNKKKTGSNSESVNHEEACIPGTRLQAGSTIAGKPGTRLHTAGSTTASSSSGTEPTDTPDTHSVSDSSRDSEAAMDSRGHGAMDKGHGAMDRGHGAMDRGHGAMDRGHGAMDRGHGAMERRQGEIERGQGATDRGHGATDRGHGATDRGHGAMDRGHGAMDRGHGAMERRQGAMDTRRSDSPHTGQATHTNTEAVRAGDLTTGHSTQTMTSSAVLDHYRLGVNHLAVAVELGRLASLARLPLAVEVRFRYGWKVYDGLLDDWVEDEVRELVSSLLKDAVVATMGAAQRVYQAHGSDVYFFGRGDTSADGYCHRWVQGPEVGRNQTMGIYLLFGDYRELHVENVQALDDLSQLAIMYIITAAEVISQCDDRFKSSLHIQKSILAIFTVLGKKVACDNETLALLESLPLYNAPPPPPKLSIQNSFTSTSSPLTTPPHSSPLTTPSHSSPLTTPSHSSQLASSSFFPSTTAPSLSHPGSSLSSPAPSPSPSSLSHPGPSLSHPGPSFSHPGPSLSHPGPSFSHPGPSFPASLFMPSAHDPINESIWSPSVGGVSQPATFNPTLPYSSTVFKNAAPDPKWEQEKREEQKKLAKAQMEVESLKSELNRQKQAVEKERQEKEHYCDEYQQLTDSFTMLTVQRDDVVKCYSEMEKEKNKEKEEHVTEVTSLKERLLQQQKRSDKRLSKSEQELEDVRLQLQNERAQRHAVEVAREQDLLDHDRKRGELESELLAEKQRAENAELKELKIKLDLGLKYLNKSGKDMESRLAQIQQDMTRYQGVGLPVPEPLRQAERELKNTLQSMSKARDTSKELFEDQIRRVREGEKLKNLPVIDVPCPPPPPDIPTLTQQLSTWGMVSSVGAAGDCLSQAITPAPAPAPTPAPDPATWSRWPTAAAVVARNVPPQATPATVTPAKKTTVTRPPGFGVKSEKKGVDKLFEPLLPKYPQLTREDMELYLQKVRQEQGSLSGLTLVAVRDQLERYIINALPYSSLGESGWQSVTSKRTNNRSASSSSSTPVFPSSTSSPSFSSPSSSPSRRGEASSRRVDGVGRMDGGSVGTGTYDDVTRHEVDPCCICYEELLPSNTLTLGCQHRFHDACIRKWFNDKSTCPLCQKHTLLADEYPALC